MRKKSALSATIQPPLSRSDIDRDDARRLDPGALGELIADPSTRAVLLRDGRFAVSGDALVLVPADRLDGASTLAYLGRSTAAGEDGQRTGFVLQTVDDDAAEAVALAGDADARWLALRDVATILDDRDAGLATEASALSNWHTSSGYCPRCGSATTVVKAGWARDCPSCGNEIFPRTDPAVIVAVHDDEDRILLGSNALWEHNRYSVLAGFVEAGESLEAAVIREISEEAGVPVVDPVYLGSQPWPFPRSLMLGYRARVADGVDPDGARADGEEILDLRWFTREQLRAIGDEIILPGASSIAHWLIESWLTADGGPGQGTPVSP
ncbi:NAD(+) diphosphatase [Mycetocola reblochoni]|uniref:NAD(+) diphosphatase n=2 Tax=Mycetocola reblochoni TaxID=331618 RepID=A0A1R4J8Q6_9MICO|nr:NAD(+) diphosphatase [Mycetocola reblochoni]RLP70102.1 NAD(+) diphosphatase [Mycetocola reblochoni]SJN28466.1 NADH pyrophosphatase [Mycetocola reblochoni REB411]